MMQNAVVEKLSKIGKATLQSVVVPEYSSSIFLLFLRKIYVSDWDQKPKFLPFCRIP
jgi:hypothetical protein